MLKRLLPLGYFSIVNRTHLSLKQGLRTNSKERIDKLLDTRDVKARLQIIQSPWSLQKTALSHYRLSISFIAFYYTSAANQQDAGPKGKRKRSFFPNTKRARSSYFARCEVKYSVQYAY